MARHVKKGDIVKVTSGNSKGRTGKILKVITGEDRIIVEGVNVRHKHVKPSQANPQGGRIEKEMPRAKPETKWTMNNTLAAIGIKHARHRKRAIAIGEKIGLYEDWPVSKGCTIPYVPVWIDAVVKGNS